MDIEKNKKEIIFKPEGEINLYNETLFKNELLDNLDDGIKRVIIDMTNLTFIDSSGIGMIIYLKKNLARKQKDLVLKSVPKEVLKVLQIGRIDDVIEII